MNLRHRIRLIKNRWIRDFVLRLILISIVILTVFVASGASIEYRTMVLMPTFGICSALVFVPFRTWLVDQYRLHAVPSDERGLDLVLVYLDARARGDHPSPIHARIISDTLSVIERQPGWYPRIPWHLLSLMIVGSAVALAPRPAEHPAASLFLDEPTGAPVPEATISIRPPEYVGIPPTTVPLKDLVVPQYAEVSIETPCSTTLTWLLRPEGSLRVSESTPTESTNVDPPQHRENCIRITSFDATSSSLALVGKDYGMDSATGTPSVGGMVDRSDVDTGGGTGVGTDVARQLVHIGIRPDEAPDVALLSPTTPATWSGGPYPQLRVRVSDDFGLQAVSVVWTRARGAGESVQFSESRMQIGPTPSDRAFSPGRHVPLETTPLELTESIYALPFDLSMSSAPWLEQGQPGDIYYVHVEATDIGLFPWRTSRSEVAIFVLPDTTSSPGSLPFTIPSDPVATALQSQRKLVIDIDTLLADSPPTAEFARRSRNLGIDQRTIRLQYGQYLGETDEGGTLAQIDRPSVDAAIGAHSMDEQAETSITGPRADTGEEAAGHRHEDHHHDIVPGPDPLETPFSLGDAQSSLAAFQASLMHFHDSAETYQLYSDSVRATLKRALALMWDSERYLRTDQPRTARPYAIAALEHIKALQAHARIYVRKTAIRTPPISRLDQLSKTLPTDRTPTNLPSVDTDLFDEVRSTLLRWELGMDAELPLDRITQWSIRQSDDPSAFVRDLLRARENASVRATVLRELDVYNATAYGFQVRTQP